MASQAVKKFSSVIKNLSSSRTEYYVSSRNFVVSGCKCNLDETSAVKGSMNVNEFLLLPSQVKFVKRLFEIHPDIASNFRIKSPLLKTAYMNVLLSLIETVRKPFEEISKDDLYDAYAALESMTCVGFKLDWLQKKLNELSKKKLQASLSEYPLASQIMVKNLPFYTSEDFLRKEFSAFGEIAEVALIKDRPIKRNICYAFIQFTSQEDAFLAIEFMDRRMYKGWKIYIDIVKPRKLLQKAANYKVADDLETILEKEKAESLVARGPISYSYDDVFFDNLTY